MICLLAKGQVTAMACRVCLSHPATQVDAFFSEPVLPLGVSSLFTKDAAVIRVQRLSPEHSRFQLEGSVAADAQVWLPSCTDYAGNRGELSTMCVRKDF
eukprot:1158586-Pelagomonas_calceolata.AAC.6